MTTEADRQIEIAKVIPAGDAFTVAIGALGIKIFAFKSDAQECCDALNRQIAPVLNAVKVEERAAENERCVKIAKAKAKEYRAEAQAGGSDLWSARARSADAIAGAIRVPEQEES